MKKELTTLAEKEQFVQIYLNIEAKIENIFLTKKQIEIVDVEDNHMIVSSSKFIRSLNESLIVARRETYTNCKEFMKEYYEQKGKPLFGKIKEQYPSCQQYLVSGDEVAVFIPHEKGTMIVQDCIRELVKK